MLDELTNADVLVVSTPVIPRCRCSFDVPSKDLHIMVKLHVSSSPGLSPVSRATKSFTVILTICCQGSPIHSTSTTTIQATTLSVPSTSTDTLTLLAART